MLVCAGVSSQAMSPMVTGNGSSSSHYGTPEIHLASLPGLSLSPLQGTTNRAAIHDRRRSYSLLNLSDLSDSCIIRAPGFRIKRRPSFPQTGLHWRPRHRDLHENRRDCARRKTVSVCVLPETEEEDEEDGQTPERGPVHEHTCPLYQLTSGATIPLRENIENVNEISGKLVSPECRSTASHPHFGLPPAAKRSPVQCSCSHREELIRRNTSKDDQDEHNYDSGGYRPGGRRRRRRKRTRRETIIINVGGQVFETYRSTLRRLRTPIFHSDDSLELYYRRSHGDYFFDRDATAFGSILNFLRTGELHIPTNMCGPALQNELEFWGIEEVDIARCCWTQYNTWKTQCRSLEKLEYDRKFSTTQQVPELDPDSSCWVRYRTKIWTFLQDPGSSKKAKAYAWLSIIFVFISIFSFCAETHPLFKVKARDMTHLASFYGFFNLEPVQWAKLIAFQNATNASPLSNLTDSNSPEFINSTLLPATRKRRAAMKKGFEDNMDNCLKKPIDESVPIDTEIGGNMDLPHPALLMMDIICLVFFTAEYLTRFICSPSKINFLRALQNIVDFLAFAPDYVELIFLIIDPPRSEGMAIMEMLFIFRILRLFRIFRLIRHVPGLWILLYTLKASFNELMLMCVFLLIGMVVFATLIHFLEPEGTFTNIPIGFWWSVVTMTTVGYGDMYPSSAAGYFIGSCCAVAGLLMIAFTVPIIVSNFVLYYTHVQYGLARRDRDIERMKEAASEGISPLDVERSGATPSGTSLPSVLAHHPTTKRNGKSYSQVNNKSDVEASCNSHMSPSDGAARTADQGGTVAYVNNTSSSPHTVLILEDDHLA